MPLEIFPIAHPELPKAHDLPHLRTALDKLGARGGDALAEEDDLVRISRTPRGVINRATLAAGFVERQPAAAGFEFEPCIGRRFALERLEVENFLIKRRALLDIPYEDNNPVQWRNHIGSPMRVRTTM